MNKRRFTTTKNIPSVSPGFAKTAREEGFEEIGEWLETLARAEKSHADRFTTALEQLA